MRGVSLLSYALFACVACGGVTTGGTGVGPGTGGTGGSQSGDGGESTGTGGAGGVGGSSGTARVSFTTLAGRSYCSKGCTDTTPRLTITTKDGVAVDLGSLCQVDCSTCTPGACPPVACAPPALVTRAELDWDGHYFSQSTCGAGTSCLKEAVAPSGTYHASFCATPGYMSGPDGGFLECVQTGSEECVNIPFEFPSSTPATGVLGTRRGPIGR